MCGIAGIFNLKKNLAINPKILQELNDDLSQRGPDTKDNFFSENYALTHTRLAILDLENGQQPYRFKEQTLSYNGELYNYQELNREISDKIKIETNCDTETVLKYIATMGISQIKNFDGMYAFAIADENSLILARDHVGLKPLFYTIKNNQLFFSSLLGSLTKIQGKKLDQTAFLHFLTNGNLTFKNRTIYQNIYTVEAGTYLIFRRDQLVPFSKRYYQPQIAQKYYQLPFAEQKEKLTEILDRAVSKRLISDVSLGTYLSGGLDSSIISQIASKYKPNLTTLSICYKEDQAKENYFAKLVAQKIKSNHFAIAPGISNFKSEMSELIKVKKTPLSTPNEVLIYKLAKFAKERLSVVLSGEGADELFLGYGAISRSPFDLIRYQNKKYLNNQPEFNKSLLRLYGKTEFEKSSDHISIFLRRLNNFEILQIFNQDSSLTNSIEELENYYQELFLKENELNLYTKYQQIIFDLNLKSLLERLDFNTMQASLEARAPFLDKEVIDFALNIPLSSKLRLKTDLKCLCRFNSFEISNKFDTTKYILRESFSSKIPKEILQREKQSFSIPFDSIYDNQNSNQDILTKIALDKSGLFNKESLIYLVNNWQLSKNNFKLWQIDNLLEFTKIL